MIKKYKSIHVVLMVGVVFAVLSHGHLISESFAQVNANFRVQITFFGLDSKKPEIFAFVTVQNVSKGALLNATKIDLANSHDNTTDGIAEFPISFANMSISAGEKFRACALVLEGLRLVCEYGYKSPSDRAEFINLVIPSSATLNENRSLFN